ncbi:MAG: phosphoenolpyruvate--protein phosphotransferase [Thermodesulfobacteriota bacterium]|nr:phosphoenolpyruvate--protein phosphotransferase [Thermodesulfobacteriota bacterium]
MSQEKRGLAISPGFSVGNVLLINQAKTAVQKRKINRREVVKEINRFQNAVEISKDEISALRGNQESKYKTEHIEILDFNILILEDEILAGEVINIIETKLINAEWALNNVLTHKSREFSKVSDLYMKERLADFYYIAERIIKNLRGSGDNFADIKRNTVLVAHDLSPIDALKYCENDKVKGILTDLGGTTSHTAIIARSMGIPTVMSLGDISISLDTGQKVYVDGYKGIATWKVKKHEKDQMEDLRSRYVSLEESLMDFSKLSGETKDKKIVSVKANIELTSEVEISKKYGAEGIGMYRTEFLFTRKQQFPSMEEQYSDYIGLFKDDLFNEITIRTLDTGGDKSDDINNEENNPALGVRGIRYSLLEKETFIQQIKAILKVAQDKKKPVRILLPMISTLDEVVESTTIINNLKKDFVFDEEVLIGVVIETPSAALLVNEICKHIDFISIGTNDLIQYTLAADRTNENLRNIFTHFQPSVIRILKYIIDNVPDKTYISVCGEMANDINCLPIFIGLGINELSMNYHSIPKIKSVIHDLSYNECENVLKDCLKTTDPTQVKEILSECIDHNIVKAKSLLIDI